MFSNSLWFCVLWNTLWKTLLTQLHRHKSAGGLQLTVPHFIHKELKKKGDFYGRTLQVHFFVHHSFVQSLSNDLLQAEP